MSTKLDTTQRADDAGAAPVSWRRRLHAVGTVFRQVFGMPDYERYLEHVASCHPGAPVLSEREYCAQMIDRKYGKRVGRCC